MKKYIFYFIVILTIGLSACSNSVSSENPAWVDSLIGEFKEAPLGNPPQSVWRYTYNGETVYYVPPQCCDQFSVLYDSDGNTICAPDGGFTGRGDGRCPDFFSNRTDELLIWRDSREN